MTVFCNQTGGQSGRFGVTSRYLVSCEEKSRSKWHRAQSLVKVDIFRRRRFIRGLRRPDTPHLVFP